MIESIVKWSLGLFFAFYLLNHSELFARVRGWLFPRLWSKAVYALECALCSAFWVLLVYSLFTGFTPLIFCVPPCCLMLNLVYLNLKSVCA